MINDTLKAYLSQSTQRTRRKNHYKKFEPFEFLSERSERVREKITTCQTKHSRRLG